MLYREKLKLNIIAKINNFLNKKGTPIYFILLLILMAGIYYPSFSDPPRSDSWSTLHFFHNLGDYPGNSKWLHVINFDPWTQIRFYPLAFLLHYWQHSLFGVNFIYSHHIFNFILYYLSIILLYNLAINFCKNRTLILIFLFIFAFLFSHFDIVIWAFHFYIIFGFCSFILGFLIYLRYLETGKKKFLLFIILLFLTGMLSYEPFALWPWAILILNFVDTKEKKIVFKNKSNKFASFLIIGVVYTFYIASFLFSRAIKTYDAPVLSWDKVLTLNPFIFFVVFFNFLYNSIFVNLIPKITIPFSTRIEDNINMGGIIEKISADSIKFNNIILYSSLIFIIVLCISMVFLVKKKGIKSAGTVSFFLFLLVSGYYILFYCRSLTNDYVYCLQQFRYQYISNAFIVLLGVYLLENLITLSQWRKIIIYLFAFIIFISNVSMTRKYVLMVSQQLKPLKEIIQNIKSGIKEEKINSNKRLYIDNSIVQELPKLCWNRQMGTYFMKGTYQWIFNRNEIKYFSFSPEDAHWIIDKDSLRIIKKQ